MPAACKTSTLVLILSLSDPLRAEVLLIYHNVHIILSLRSSSVGRAVSAILQSSVVLAICKHKAL